MEGLLSRAVANSTATVACLDVATATAVGEAAKILASFGFVIALVLIAEALLAELSLYHAGMRYPFRSSMVECPASGSPLLSRTA